MAETGSLVEELWEFSVHAYARPGVAPTLLDWQDQRGVNVNLALACLWAAGRGRALSAADIRGADHALAGWHAAAVAPLRALRRRLKAADWAGLAAEAAPVRQAVLAAELQAERAEQALIVQALAPWPAAGLGAGNQALARANLLTYLGNAAATEVEAFLATIG